MSVCPTCGRPGRPPEELRRTAENLPPSTAMSITWSEWKEWCESITDRVEPPRIAGRRLVIHT